MRSQKRAPARRAKALPVPTKPFEVLTTTHIDRILKSCDSDRMPHDFDKQDLLLQLRRCVTRWRTRTDLGKAPRKREKQIEEAYKKMEHLRKLVTDLIEDHRTWELVPGGQGLVEALDCPNIAEALDLVLKSRAKPTSPEKTAQILIDKWRAEGPNDWLRGTCLPQVYERCFKQRATRARSMDGVSSPCIRFVQAVLAELGIPGGTETISRNMTEARTSPGRRRSRAGRKRDPSAH